MKKRLEILPFPDGAESDGFFAALSSAVMPCLGFTDRTPYYCSMKGRFCTQCGSCGQSSRLQKNRWMMYHTLLSASGCAFTFDYPEDDSVEYHTFPEISAGWRWDEPFVSDAADFVGLNYVRYRDKTCGELYGELKSAIDSGCTALAADYSDDKWSPDDLWQRCWSVVCGYDDDGGKIELMQYGGGKVSEGGDVRHRDWIIFTGKAGRRQNLRGVLRLIYSVLTDPSHDRLEAEIYKTLDCVTPENAAEAAWTLMGINGVFIESRWHSAEAMCSKDNLIASIPDGGVGAESKNTLAELFFSRYIADNNNETHGIGWKIWGELGVGPHSGYMPNEESYRLIQQKEVREELKRLFRIVFDNDRAVGEGIMEVLKKSGEIFNIMEK